MAKWLLLDGYNLAFRAFYGMPELTRSDGFPTGALHGWIRTIWKLQDDARPDATLCFFDLGGAQDRLALLPEYKAQRKETPEPLERQMPVIKDLTRAMGLVGIEIEGVESDDLLASQARMLANAGHEVFIVSADKDFAQCVDDRIRILLPPPTANPKLGWRMLDVAGVCEKFGVKPDQVVDVLALVGDTSDNVAGVPGIGKKGAIDLITQYGHLDDLIARAGELKPKQREALQTHREDALRSRELVTIRTDVPVEVDFDALRYRGGSREQCYELFTRLDFRTLVAEYAPTADTIAKDYALPPDYQKTLCAARKSAPAKVQRLAKPADAPLSKDDRREELDAYWSSLTAEEQASFEEDAVKLADKFLATQYLEGKETRGVVFRSVRQLIIDQHIRRVLATAKAA